MNMKHEAFFTGLFAEVCQVIPAEVGNSESKRILKYCLECIKDGITDRDAAKNFIGYDLELPSTRRDRDGDAITKTKLFDSLWAKAQTETRKRVAIAVAKKLHNRDFGAYKKNLPLLMLYCEAVERNIASVKFVASKAMSKFFGVAAGKQTLPISVFENRLNLICGYSPPKEDASEEEIKRYENNWIATSKNFGKVYRGALSKKMVLRDERIAIESFDEVVDYDEYL